MSTHPYPAGKTLQRMWYLLISIQVSLVVTTVYFFSHVQRIEQNAIEAARLLNERTPLFANLQKADSDFLTRLGSIEGKMEILLDSLKIEGK